MYLSQDYEEELLLTLPSSYGSILYCKELILNDESLCKIKKQISSTLVCDYPLTPIERNSKEEKNIKCRAYCLDTKNCSIQEKQNQSFKFLEKKERITQQKDAFTFTPNSASFVYPTYLHINLISITGDIQGVFLESKDGTKKEIIILKQQDKSLTCLLKGNKFQNGDYTINLVTKDNKTFRSSDIFSIKVTVTSVSPNQGNIEGGVLLTIQGQNFSLREKENQVQIGGVPCQIIYSSVTQIQCITQQPQEPQSLSQEESYDVVVFYQEQKSITLDSKGKYKFIKVSNSPVISNIISNVKGKFIQGEKVIIQGKNLKTKDEETVLRIGDFQIKIDSINSDELQFTVGFDMPNYSQILTIYVGSLGSTQPEQFKASSMFYNSKCLDKSNFLPIWNPSSDWQNHFIHLDLNLTNYDPSYEVIVTFDNQLVFKPQVYQYQNNQNYIYIKIYYINQYQNINAINSITIGGDEILENPLKIVYNNQEYKNLPIFQSLQFIKNDENSFLVQYQQEKVDLLVYRVIIRQQNDQYYQFIGSIQNNFFIFNKIPDTQDFKSGVWLEGCTNYGSFEIRMNPEDFVFQSPSQSFKFVNAATGQISFSSGQKFKIQINNFNPLSNFLVLSSNQQDLFHPIFLETELNDQNIYDFTIPPYFFPNQKIQCQLQLRSQWSKMGDQLYTAYQLSKQIYDLKIYARSETMFQFSQDIVYDGQKIPQINSVSPSAISYIGGDILVFNGVNINSAPINKIIVLINGINCEVFQATDTSISCKSGFQQQIQLVKQSQIQISVNDIAAYITINPITIIMRQIDPQPFYGFLDFYDSQSKVYIPQFYIINMDDYDQQVAAYDIVLVDGVWRFGNTQSYKITVNQLTGVGTVEIASESQPFDKQTFYLRVVSQCGIYQIFAYSNQKQNFINLISSAQKGQDYLSISDKDIQSANLKIGDEIVISGTTFGTQHEIFTIKDIKNNQVYLNNILNFDHIIAKDSAITNDGQNLNINISPTISKISSNIEIDIELLTSSATLNFNGVKFKNNNYYSNLYLNIKNSAIILGSFQQNIYLNGIQGCVLMLVQYISNIPNNFILNFILSGLIQNNLFLLQNQQVVFQIFNNNVIFDKNILQSVSILYDGAYSQKAVFSNNIIYNSVECLNILGQIQMDDNICYSVQYALSVSPGSIIQSKNFYLVALEIQECAVWFHYYPISYWYYYHYLNYVEQYFMNNNNEIQNINGKAFFQTNLSKSQQINKPKVYCQQYENKNFIRSYQDFQFQGFTYTETDNIVVDDQQSYVWSIVQFSKIKQDFKGGILLADQQKLIIRDLDGSFSGISKMSNIFSKSSNLDDDTSLCKNFKQYFICQNSLMRFESIASSYGVFQQPCSLQLLRANKRLIQAESTGFVVVSGEQYKASLFDDQNKKYAAQLFSTFINYSQDTRKGITISFDINENYVFHKISFLYLSNFESISLYEQSDIQLQKSQPLEAYNCKHGENFIGDTQIQVCYKELKTPLTLFISYFPDAFPLAPTLKKEEKIRYFHVKEDWNQNRLTKQSEWRWVINAEWKMVISKGGVYNVPSLVIQGSLEITGKEDITINIGGIYIAAGSFVVSNSYTGNLVINFQSKYQNDILFNIPYEQTTFKPGYIIVNNIFQIDSYYGDQNYFRIIEYSKYQNKNCILVENFFVSQVKVGDQIIIISPNPNEENIITSILDQPLQINSGQALLTIKDALNFNLYKDIDYESINLKRNTFSPFMKIIRKNIQINNFKIISWSFGTSYIPKVFIRGVYFKNSQITQTKIAISINILDCFFDANSDQDYSISNNYSVLQSDSPIFNITNNLFLNSKNPIRLSKYYYYYYFGNFEKIQINQYDEAKLNIVVQKNLIFNCKVGLDLYYQVKLSENVIIKSSEYCSTSIQCQNHNNDLYYQCQISGVQYIQNYCQTISNILVAYSGSFFDGYFNQIKNVVSIQNDFHFILKKQQSTYDNILQRYEVQIYQSVIIADLQKDCKKSKIIQLFTPIDSMIITPIITVYQSNFYSVQCSTPILFEQYQDDQTYYPQLAFVKSTCLKCNFKDKSSLFESVSQLTNSFLVQDYQSNFLGKQSQNDLSSYIFTSQQQQSQIVVQYQQELLGRLYLRKLNPGNKIEFSLPNTNYQTHQLDRMQGIIFILQLNARYKLQASNYNQIGLRISSHDFSQLQYIQITMKVQPDQGLKLKISNQLLLPTEGLDTSLGYNILDLVKKNTALIQCGVNIYDPKNDEYHVILTSDPSCLIQVFEYTTSKVMIAVKTPILPPPPPEQANMCLAQRQLLYMIEKLSIMLKIDKRRIKMQTQFDKATCKLSRILDSGSQPDQITLAFFVDPENSDDEKSCTFSSTCSQQEQQQEAQQQNQQKDAVYSNILTISNSSIDSGLQVNNIQPVNPSSVSLCPQGQIQQGMTCVPQCTSNQFFKDGQCTGCDSSCNTCIGPTKYDCTYQLSKKRLDCKSDYITLLDASNKKQFCGNCNKDEFYFDEATSYGCKKCNQVCNTCKNGSTQYDCTVGSDQKLDCNSSYLQLLDSKNQFYCGSCSNNQYLVDNSQSKQCMDCNTSCNSCNGPSEYNCKVKDQSSGKLDCNDTYYNLNDSQNKLFCGICKKDEYYVQDTLTCKKCDQACKTCSGPSDHDCKVSKQSDKLDCNLGHITVLDDNQKQYCKPYTNCHSSCKTCVGPTQYDCSVIEEDLILDCQESQNTLKDSQNKLFCGICEQNQFQVLDGKVNICSNCHKSCKSCHGPTDYDCNLQQQSQELDCNINYFPLRNKNNQLYCGICPSNQYYVSYALIQTCAVCNDKCQTCKGPTEYDCNLIQESNLLDCSQISYSLLDENKKQYCGLCQPKYQLCVECQIGCKDECKDSFCKCKKGYYAVQGKKQACEQCPEGCSTCSSDKICFDCFQKNYDPATLCVFEKKDLQGKQKDLDSQNSGSSSPATIAIIAIAATFGAIIILVVLLKYCKSLTFNFWRNFKLKSKNDIYKSQNIDEKQRISFEQTEGNQLKSKRLSSY